MSTFRLLKTGFHTAAWNMALDEILLQKIAIGESQPVLRFYQWKPAAISLGYFQSLQAEIDEKKCKEFGVDIVRRQTGGGAVLHDDEVTYSIHIPLASKLVPQKILDSYQKICRAITKGFSEMNIEAQFVPLNDIVVDGKKISGNAQTRKQGILLQHGTVLKSVDVEKMFALLKVPDEKMKGKLISDVKQRVTSLDAHTNSGYSIPEIIEALIHGFEREFSTVQFELSEPTEEELVATERLATEKYSQKVWNEFRESL